MTISEQLIDALNVLQDRGVEPWFIRLSPDEWEQLKQELDLTIKNATIHVPPDCVGEFRGVPIVLSEYQRHCIVGKENKS